MLTRYLRWWKFYRLKRSLMKTNIRSSPMTKEKMLSAIAALEQWQKDQV